MRLALRLKAKPEWNRQRGFTLVEVCITVAILALSAAVVIPAMNNLSRASLRKTASGLSAIIRQTYENAVLSGETYRLVLVPRHKEIKIQSTSDSVAFDAKENAFVAETDELTDTLLNGDDKDKGKSADKNKKASKDVDTQADAGPAGGLFSALAGVNSAGKRAAKAGFQSQGSFSLDDHVHVLDVWTDGTEQTVAEGEAYLYFFRNGYTQEALIHLEDDDKRVFTVRVRPLTGRAEIIDSYVEPPK